MTRSKIRTSGAEGLTLSSTQLTVANGLSLTDGNLIFASGHGVDFTATGEGTGANEAEKFDDYEEGTWTPSISGRTFGATYGLYRKIGKVVYVYFDCNTLAGGDITNPYLSSFPFTGTNSGNAQYAGYFNIQEPNSISKDSNYYYVYWRMDKNVTTALLLQGNGSNHTSNVTLGNGDHFRGNGFYFTDS